MCEAPYILNVIMSVIGEGAPWVTATLSGASATFLVPKMKVCHRSARRVAAARPGSGEPTTFLVAEMWLVHRPARMVDTSMT